MCMGHQSMSESSGGGGQHGSSHMACQGVDPGRFELCDCNLWLFIVVEKHKQPEQANPVEASQKHVQASAQCLQQGLV